MSLRSRFDGFMHSFCYSILTAVRNLTFYAILPFMPLLRPLFDHLLREVDVEVNGSRPHDLVMKDSNRCLAAIVTAGFFGVCESYYEEYFVTEDFFELLCKLNKVEKTHFNLFYYFLKHPYNLATAWIHKTFNINTPENAWRLTGKHYDTDAGILLPEVMDWSRQYSTGLYEDTDDLAEACFQMRELIARKLKLKPGMTVLDIGCGYGALAEHLAERYGVKVVGYSVSKKMAEYAQERCAKKGLDVKAYGKDFREITGKYDRVVAIEVISHLGQRNHRAFFEVINRSLKDDGICVMQSISINHEYLIGHNPIYDAYCGFNAELTHPIQIAEASNGLLIIEDWQNFSHHFYLTVKAGIDNYKAKKEQIKNLVDPLTLRRYEILGASCLGGSQDRKVQLYQIVFSKNGLPGGYDRVY